MERLRLYLFVGLALAAAYAFKDKLANEPADSTVCAGPPLKDLAQREEAREQGYEINARYGCIDKASFAAVNRQNAEWESKRKASAENADAATVPAAGLTLAEARRDFRTAVSIATTDNPPLPSPPSSLFERVDYRSGDLALPAFITPNPRNYERHPAIIWITGGDSNSLDDFWSAGSPDNDQSARAFREAGMIMMFPTLRGGNSNPGGKEFLLGEVDDILAAANYLAGLPYVDADQIYLGGHSTGGTLALLTAESSNRFSGVFAFGPVARADSYPSSIVPVNLAIYGAQEVKLRSPLYWLDGISRPTWIIEGKTAPSNIGELDVLCGKTRNPLLHCLPVDGESHFSVLTRATQIIARKLVNRDTKAAFTLQESDFK